MARESKVEELKKSLPGSAPTSAPGSERVHREKLPQDLQSLVDKEGFFDDLYDGNLGDSTDTSVRYAAYATRLRTIMLSAHRYVAYTSDIGESFRPIAHPYLVKGAYGISWAYLIGDVSNESWKAYKRNQALLHPDQDQHKSAVSDKQNPAPALTKIPAIEDWRSVAVQRAIFQSVASMGLPAFTIHSIVRYSGRALKDAKNLTIRTWGPIGLGLAAVPALPYMFDKPVEHVVDWVFYNGFKAIGGEGAVTPRMTTGRGHPEKPDKLKEL